MAPDAHGHDGSDPDTPHQRPADPLPPTTPAAPRTSSLASGLINMPERIGPYHLLEPLGEGGMGTVYLAERREPVRLRVALKIIKPGMDTREVIARFESERQALALMNHPNIARVLDAGATADGRPYFVMEHVPGVPITHYCDTHRLPNPERLALFALVCNAVQHAHEKGLIHRDLKPSNVLVMMQDGKPIPKIIDFGVAKATNQTLTEKTLFTRQGQLVGTPEYMSPEQAEMSGLDVDARTDIYSLGVILYELLVGALPFDSATLRRAGFAEIQRIIREVDPPKPSTRLSTLGDSTGDVASRRRIDAYTLQRDLRGDLDWITMKAMEKDRTRRYDSAAEFGDDVARYLAHRPVLACPPSAGYRLRKFVRRHRGAVSIATALLVAAVAISGLAYSRWSGDRRLKAEQARVESVEKAARERRADDLVEHAVQLMRQQEYAQSEADLLEAIRLNPSHFNARANLVTVKRFQFERTHDSATAQEALAQLDALTKLDPTRAEPWNIKGVILRSIGQAPQAIEAFKQAIRADRNYAPAYVSISNAFAEVRDWDSAAQHLSLASQMELKETDARPWLRFHNLAALQLARDNAAAVTTIGRALDVREGSDQPCNWLLHGKILLLAPVGTDASRAIESLIRAEKDPRQPSPRARRYRALAALRKGDFADTSEQAQLAIKLGDQPATYARLIRAAALGRLGRRDAAKEEQSAALAVWPKELDADPAGLSVRIEEGVMWFETKRELDALRGEVDQALK